MSVVELSIKRRTIISIGVPEGLILAPILFPLFLNDLACNIGDKNCVLCADYSYNY